MKLKTCPWCAGIPTLLHTMGRWRVGCDGDGPYGCGTLPETGWRDTREEAIDAWNKRAVGPAKRSERKVKP